MSEEQPPREMSLREFNPQLAQAMDELRRPIHPKLQENVFIKRWLPLFTDLTQEEKEKIHDVNSRRPMMLWVQEVALKSTNPVDIFDGDEYLYTVPPLHKDIVLPLADRNPNYDITAEITTAARKAQILPGLGEEHLRERVTKQILPQFVLDETAARQWNVIFERYGLPLIPVTDMLKAAPEAKPAETFEDDVGEYTEL